VGKEEILRGILRIRKIDQWLRTFFERLEKDIILNFDGRVTSMASAIFLTIPASLSFLINLVSICFL